MNEPENTTPTRSRRIRRIKIALAVIAALVVLAFIGFRVTVYFVTEKYESLHKVVQQGDAFAVRRLLMRGADVNERDGERNGRGCTPLHDAAFRGHTEVVELLIARGADVNAKDKFGKTPLPSAIEKGFEDMADLLRKHGARR